MTDQPAVGPLGAEDVKLLMKGDLLRVVCPFGRLRHGNVVRVRTANHYLSVEEDMWTDLNPTRFAFIGRPIDADGWIEHDGSDRNPLPGEKVDARGSKFVLEPTARPSEEVRWDRVRFWRPSRLASTPQVETLGPAAAVAADVVRGEPDDDLKLVIAHTIVEELRAQHPGIEQIDNERGDIWLPGGSTPQSSGCIVDIHSVAQAVEQQVQATFAPGHTDLMVSPKSIDAFLEANPLPDNTGGEVEASGAERERLAKAIREAVGHFRMSEDMADIAAEAALALRPQPTAPAGDGATWRALDDNGLAEVLVNGKRITSMPSYSGAQEVAERINDALRTTPAPSVDLAELKRWVEDYEQEAALDAEEDGDLSHVDDGLREFPLAKIKALIAQIERGEG